MGLVSTTFSPMLKRHSKASNLLIIKSIFYRHLPHIYILKLIAKTGKLKININTYKYQYL